MNRTTMEKGSQMDEIPELQSKSFDKNAFKVS